MTQSSERLLSIGRLLERGVGLDLILDAIVDQVVNRLGADRGTLYLVDRNRQQIFSKAAHLPEIQEIRLDIGQGIAGMVAQTGKSSRLSRAYDDGHFEKEIDQRTGYTTHSMLAVPLFDHDGTTLGVLQVLNKVSGDFDDDDEALLTKLAKQAADILEKTSLYAELRREKSGQRRLDYRYNFIVGGSAAMRQVYELVDKAAGTTATVILQGESGTGKGLMARAIHLNSARKDAPFVVLDCTTLPATLIENELFGHARGAFTGADKMSKGRLEQADGGTLFIDEIGELPVELQAKLLRVIQDREFERVGGSETIKVDFRLIAATNRDLDQMVADGTFREDLYYRIRVVPMILPPLRDRGAEDIRRLVEHFMGVFTKKHRTGPKTITEAAFSRLLSHRWPGNIRELENCIESTLVLSDGEKIQPQNLALPHTATTATAPSVATQSESNLGRTLEEAEREYILKVLDNCDGNRSEAARRLGVSRNTLARKVKGYSG